MCTTAHAGYDFLPVLFFSGYTLVEDDDDLDIDDLDDDDEVISVSSAERASMAARRLSAISQPVRPQHYPPGSIDPCIQLSCLMSECQRKP
jgi:hypothetical protein